MSHPEFLSGASGGPRSGFVRVRGAREHNLKHIDVDIPRDALVVFTGVSGSGKSSLAFGTIFAEAQRRYFESVAPYARRLMDQVGVPAVDSIDGLPPAVALQQQRGTPSARSSVGSVTSMSSLVRMLYSRAGTYPAHQPMLYAEDFSPNTPQGACPTCHGLGRTYTVPEKLLVPDDAVTIRDGAIAAWPPAWGGQNLRDILVSLGYDVDRPWRSLPKKQRDWILFTDEQPTVPVYAGFTPAETRAARRRKTEPSYQGTFTSARAHVLHSFATTQSAAMKRRAARFMIGVACATCHGKRLTRAALSVTVAGYDIGDLSRLSLDDLHAVVEPIGRGDFAHLGVPPRARAGRQPPSPTARDRARRVVRGQAAHEAAPDVRRTANLSDEKLVAAQRLCQDLAQRLRGLNNLGLGYLTLERSTPTLSPGELQRVRIATQIHANLFGVIYVLDEPSAGLHSSDAEALFKAFAELKQAGNSLFVVEHDVSLMRKADWLVDIGPHAGELGGRLLYSGPPQGLPQQVESITGRYLDAKPHRRAQPARQARAWLRLEGITKNNVRDLSVEVPLGVMTTVTGVSGSGKSSLVSQALVEVLSDHLGYVPPASEDADDEPVTESDSAHSGRIVSGGERIRRLVTVDQKPIGRTPRSNLATYTGLFDHVRQLFAASPAARAKRWGPARFSFNVAGGRCPTCEGSGAVSVELLFMPSAYSPCPTCHGKRYAEPTLAIQVRGKSIADVLAMTVDGACAFFTNEDAIRRPLELLRQIGVGYLRLG
ncbi:MAG TPA: excinuclease ABC subunit UvrA, partial [Planctomycetota bacterium]|nr:excinuclease ABC subunit UvrA [Planctomycetota bacterium]